MIQTVGRSVYYSLCARVGSADNGAFSNRCGFPIMSLSQTTTWPTWSLQLCEKTALCMQWKHSRCVVQKHR